LRHEQWREEEGAIYIPKRQKKGKKRRKERIRRENRAISYDGKKGALPFSVREKKRGEKKGRGGKIGEYPILKRRRRTHKDPCPIEQKEKRKERKEEPRAIAGKEKKKRGKVRGGTMERRRQ